MPSGRTAGCPAGWGSPLVASFYRGHYMQLEQAYSLFRFLEATAAPDAQIGKLPRLTRVKPPKRSWTTTQNSPRSPQCLCGVWWRLIISAFAQLPPRAA